jgi:hypothetical protein
MLPLHASLDAISDTGAALDAVSDEILGTMRSAAERFDDIPIPIGWATTTAMRDAIEAAGATISGVVDTIGTIRSALRRTASEYAAADHRSAQRHGPLAW